MQRSQKLDIEQSADNKSSEKGCEALFGAIRELAACAMRGGRTREGALALISQAIRFADLIIEDYEIKEPLAEPVACKAGCYYCCCYEVVLTPAEALLLGNYVKQRCSENFLVELMKKIDRTLRLREGRSVEERAKVLHDTPCFFLTKGKCSVYDVRPFACRALHSLDAHKCKEAVLARRRVVEFTGYNHRLYIIHTAKEALSQFCELIGCQTTELTIARAMKQYFQSPGLTEDWIRGGAVFEV